jgi:hypothetical protein
LKLGKRNGVGMLLYHTKPRKSSHSKDDDDNDEEDEEDDDEDDSVDQGSTVHVLLPLVPPGIHQVQTIRSCLKQDRNLQQEFCDSCETKDEEPRIAPLQTALEEGMRIFRNSKCVKEPTTSTSNKSNELVDTRSIWIFTNRENPYPSSSSHLIQNVAREAKEQGIQIIVWPLPLPTLSSSSTPAMENTFSQEAFFHEIASYNAFPQRRLSSSEEMVDALDDLQQQWKKTRRLYWGPMWFPDWKQQQQLNKEKEKDDAPAIMIDWFRFVQPAKKPSKVKIDQYTKRYVLVVLLGMIHRRLLLSQIEWFLLYFKIVLGRPSRCDNW